MLISGLAAQNVDIFASFLASLPVDAEQNPIAVDRACLEECLLRYSKPEECWGIICYAALMVWEAVKFVFAKTTWQETVDALAARCIQAIPLPERDVALPLLSKALNTELLNILYIHETGLAKIDVVVFKEAKYKFLRSVIDLTALIGQAHKDPASTLPETIKDRLLPAANTLTEYFKTATWTTPLQGKHLFACLKIPETLDSLLESLNSRGRYDTANVVSTCISTISSNLK